MATEDRESGTDYAATIEELSRFIGETVGQNSFLQFEKTEFSLLNFFLAAEILKLRTQGRLGFNQDSEAGQDLVGLATKAGRDSALQVARHEGAVDLIETLIHNAENVDFYMGNIYGQTVCSEIVKWLEYEKKLLVNLGS